MPTISSSGAMLKKYHAVLFTMCQATTEKTFGAHKVAHELRTHGFDTLVINYLDHYSVEDLIKILTHTVSEQTLFVGFSNTFLGFYQAKVDRRVVNFPKPMEAFLPHSKEDEAVVAGHIRSINPNCKIVVGGTRTQANCPNKLVDYAVLGYADVSVVSLANHLKHGTPISSTNYKNLFGVHIVDGGLAPEFDFNNSSMNWCSDDIVVPGEILPLETSRGCIFACKFCNYRLNGKSKVDYIKHSDIIYNELCNNYEKYGITRYRLLDDTFNDTEEKIEIMADISSRLPFKPTFSGYARLDLMVAKPHTISKLIDLGFRGMFFGIETLHRDAGRVIGKGGDPDRLVQAIIDMKNTHGDSIHLTGSFICGLPGESRESVELTMERLISNQIPLDTVYYHPLFIGRQANSKWNSTFSLDFEKYGYRETADQATYDSVVNWQSDHMSYDQAVAMTNDFSQKMIQQRKQFSRSQAEIIFNEPGIIDKYKTTLFNYLNITPNV